MQLPACFLQLRGELRRDTLHVGSVLRILLVLRSSRSPEQLVLLLERCPHLCLLLLVLLLLFMECLGVTGKGPIDLPGP